MAQQLKLKATYLAPSKYLGRVISKIVRETLPKTSVWKVSVDFNQERVLKNASTGKEYKMYESALSDSYSSPFMCSFCSGQWKKDECYPNEVGYFLTDSKVYILRGWVDFDIKKNEVSIFYEVMGNVVRDLPTALSMVML